jgi:ComF family protein
MSNFFRRSTVQVLNSSARGRAFFGQDCLLCAGASGESVVCGECARFLPTLATGCARCAAPLPQPGICGDCQRHPPSFEAALAAFEYRFPVDRLIHRFKFAGDLAVGRWLALQLLERVRAEPRPDLIVAPPLTPARLRGRGFNQALEIGRVMGRRLGVRCAAAALAKTRDTAPQPGLSRRERRANLRRAFRCDAAFSGEHVALVDDVMTTGATADALARVLRAAGAGRVSVWAVARTPDPIARG